jgi:hypothetical protein
MTRVAIVGFGWWGKNVASQVLTSAKMKLAAIVDGRIETMEIGPMNPPVIVNLERFAAAAAAGSQESYDVPLQEMRNTVAAFKALTRSAQSGCIEPVPYVRVADL